MQKVFYLLYFLVFASCSHEIKHVRNSRNRLFAPDSLWHHMLMFISTIGIGCCHFGRWKLAKSVELFHIRVNLIRLVQPSFTHSLSLCVSMSRSFNWAFVPFCYFFVMPFGQLYLKRLCMRICSIFSHKKNSIFPGKLNSIENLYCLQNIDIGCIQIHT